MSFRRWPAIALALSLCACAGDPDLPRSYPQPGLFASNGRPTPKAPPAAPPAYVPPAVQPPPSPAPQAYAGPPAYSAPAYAPPPYRPELVPAPGRVVATQASGPPAYALPANPQDQGLYPQDYVPAARSPQAAYVPPPYRPELVPGQAATVAPPPADPRVAMAPPVAPPPVVAPAPPVRHYAAWTDEDYRYRIGPGDELALRFLLNPDLNAPVIVGPDGRGVFPLVSAVKVANLTTDQANASLTQAYGRILRKPQVEVLVTAYGSSQIYVGGEVRDPGVRPIKGQLTTAQAIMTAGGILPTARTGRVVVLRQRPDGQLLMKEVDLKAYLTKGKAEADFAILPGDLIFVPRSKIAEVDLFVDQYINGVLPFSRGVSYSINQGKPY